MRLEAYAPYQPSGNGISGQASSLSLADFGGFSSSMAFLTASSSRPNSSSLIVLFECAEIFNERMAMLPKLIEGDYLAELRHFDRWERSRNRSFLDEVMAPRRPLTDAPHVSSPGLSTAIGASATAGLS